VGVPKETPKKKTTVTSSLIEISKDQLGNRAVVRGGEIMAKTQLMKGPSFQFKISRGSHLNLELSTFVKIFGLYLVIQSL
jgi:hypothetical protein